MVGNESIHINKYLPIAILYFFLNSFLLPLGLLYTSLLTPVFLFWLIQNKSFYRVWYFFALTAPFVIIHFLNGVDTNYYLKSYALFFSVYVFILAFYQFLKNCRSIEDIYKQILILNGFMVIVSLIILFIPSLELEFWNDNTMSLGNIKMRRLKMLTYEPSYYSILFAPIVIYYIIRVARRDIPQRWLYLALVLIPLFLSLSFGVILGVALALLVLVLMNARKIILNKTTFPYVVALVAILTVGLLAFIALFPESVFLVRIQNTLSGKDISFNGRTLDSFILAVKIGKERSLVWGVGLGQVKIHGLEIFKEYYNWDLYTINDIGIPNNLGDFLATFGIVGFSLKLLAEFYLYYKTRVSRNFYRQALFLFIFIYQFTGSYIMNIAEYAIWILAFKQDLFSQFDKNPSASGNIAKKY